MKPRKIMMGVLLLPAVAAAAILLWQPEALQRKVLEAVTSKIERETPYEIHAGRVRGNFFTHFSLERVTIGAKGENSPSVDARALKIGVRWRALLDRRIDVDEIIWVNPVLRLTIGKNKELVLPVPAARPASGQKTELPLYIRRIAIENGELHLVNRSREPPTHLDIRPLALEASLTPAALTLQELLVGVGGGTIRARGTADLSQPVHAALQLTIHALPVETVLRAGMEPPAPLRAEYSGQWTLSMRGPSWTVASVGTLDGASLSVDAAADRQGSYRGKIRLAPLALSELWRVENKVSPARISADLAVSGETLKNAAVSVQGTARAEIPGSAGRTSTVALLRLNLDAGVGPATLVLSMDGLSAGATAQLNLPARRIESQFQTAFTQLQGLAAWVPSLADAQGQGTASGSVRGSFDALTVDVKAHGRNVGANGKEVAEADVTVRGGTAPGQQIVADIHGKEISWTQGQPSSWDIARLEGHFVGHARQWAPDVNASFRNSTALRYRGTFTQEKRGWTLGWDQLAFTPVKEAALQNTRPGLIRSSGEGVFQMQDLTLSNGVGTVAMERASWGSSAVEGTLSVHRLAVGPFIQMVEPAASATGTLDGEIKIAGRRDAPSGTITLSVSSGSVQGVTFNECRLGARLEPPWIQVSEFAVHMPAVGEDIVGRGRAPMHPLLASQPDLPVDLTFDAPHLGPQLLTLLVKGLVIDRGGEASVHLAARGRYPDLMVDGNLKAAFSHVAFPPAGVDLRSFVADIRSNGKTIEILSLGGQTPKGPIRVSGKSVLPNLNFFVKGEDVVIKIPKQLDARLNLALNIGGDLDGPDVSGEIHLHDATYTQPIKTKKDREKEAAEAEAEERAPEPTHGEEQGPSIWEGTTLNVHAEWPRNVWYRDGLTKIETSGDLSIQKDEGGTTPYMSGRIALVRGTYDAFSKDFLMDSGDIVFTGPPDINPILNVRAKYSNGGTDIYLDVKGALKKPELHLSSNPPMSENDIISVLVTGSPLNQIGGSQTPQTSRSEQATALAGSVVGSYLTKELRENGMDLGLDVVRVDPTASGSRLTVGRYIGQKLFISYGQPLRNDSGRLFTADYYLDKIWTLEGQTGSTDDNHMDVQFRYPLNTPGAGAKKEAALPVPLPSTGTTVQ